MNTQLIASAALAALFSFSSALASDANVDAIMEAVETEKIERLEAYLELEANAGAQDRAEGLAHLIDAYLFLGQTGKAPLRLEERYGLMDKGADANLPDLFGNVVQPLIQLYASLGEKEKARAFVGRVRSDMKDHPMAEQIGQVLDQAKGGLDLPSPGDTMEIAFTDLNGKKFDLAAMKGKVVLVDFWATWCGPCITEMPNVIAAYKKFHEKGFEIVGISLDQDEDALKSFIEKNGMTWPQYFDGKGWQSDLAAKFGIQGIPATFLIGKDGKIAATDLRGDALEAKLAELLN